MTPFGSICSSVNNALTPRPQTSCEKPEQLIIAIPLSFENQSSDFRLKPEFRLSFENQSSIFRALPALEELHGLEEDRSGFQVFAGGVGPKNRAVLFCAPAADGDRGDPEGVRQRGAAPPVRGGTRGDHHPRGLSGATAHEAARSRPGLLRRGSLEDQVENCSRLTVCNFEKDAFLCWARLWYRLSPYCFC